MLILIYMSIQSSHIKSHGSPRHPSRIPWRRMPRAYFCRIEFCFLSFTGGVSLDVCKSVVIKPLHSYQLAVLALRNLTQGVRPLYNTYKLYTSEKLAAPIRATKTNGLVNHEDLILQSTSSKATKPFTQRLLSPKSILAFGCCHGLARQSNPKLLSASQ